MILAFFLSGFIANASEFHVLADRLCDAPKLKTPGATVLYVSDGDTVVLRASDGTKVRVRMLGIDTPETHFNNKSQGVWAERATSRLKELLPQGSSVSVSFDRTLCDSNGRTLAYLEADGIDVNRQMILEGWAINYCVAPNLNRCEEYGLLAQQNAQRESGFLGDPSVRIPYLFRADVHENQREYFIGNIVTKIVVSSTQMESVPIGQRVFFYSARRVQPPFRFGP